MNEDKSILFLTTAALGSLAVLFLTTNPTSKPKKENVDFSTKIKVTNHFIQPLKISKANEDVLMTIPPHKSVEISRYDLLGTKWYIGKTLIHVFKTISNSPEIHFGGVEGMYIYNDINENPTSMISGPTEIIIENLTLQNLKLSGIPEVPPLSQVLYRGSKGDGLDLGSTFLDLDHRFKTYQMNKPITRIVFGNILERKPIKERVILTVENMLDGNRISSMGPGGILEPSYD
jgi:hypothetical protein